MKNYVTGFMFSQDRRKIALITKINPEWQRGLINGIGGKIEAGESAVDAMCREFLEETGISTAPSQWTAFAVIGHHDLYHVNFFFTFDDRVTSVRTTEKEIVDVYDVTNLPANLVRNLHWLIPLALSDNMDFAQPVMLNELVVPE